MLEIQYESNLGFYNEGGIITISAKQYDTARKFIFEVLNNGLVYEFDEGDKVYLRVLKADGKQFESTCCCYIENNKIIVDPSLGNGNQLLTAEGINKCELHFVDANEEKQLTTWTFNILVQGRVHDGSNIASEDSFDLLEFFAYSNINNTIELMEAPTDFNMVYYMDNLNNRINNTIRSVANAYYDNYENGLKVQTEKMQGTSEDGDTYLNVSDSVSANIEIIVRKLAIKLSSDSTVIDRILDIACRETKIGKNKMKITIQNMITNDKEYVIDLMRKIIIYYIGYLKKDKKTIHSINFISIMKRTYNVSNTKDQGLIDIKNALHELMKRNSAEYLKTERVATLSNMKACCFYYWLLYVNEKVE